MHDSRGRPLSAGDLVMIPAIVTAVSDTEDYCNVSLRTTIGRRPDGQKEFIHAINTGVLVKIDPSE